MQNFKVQSIKDRGKRAWAVVRQERNAEPAIILIHYANPALAFRDVYLLNLHALAESREKINEPNAKM
jgi:hypothetical protein